MGARSMFRRRIPLWTAAVLFGSGFTAAHADDDTFFSDLAKADFATKDATPIRTADARPAEVAGPPAIAPSQPAAKSVPSTGALLQTGLKPGDTTGTIAPRQTIDRADWMPEHAAASADQVQPAPTHSGRAQATAKAPDKADPEPDIAIEPPSAPSRDPLDHPAAPAAAAPVLEALPPLNAALKAALDKRDGEAIRGAGAGERRKERAAVSFFYAAHGFAPVWSTDGKPAASVPSVLARLAKAGDDALTLPVVAPTVLKTEGTPEDIVAAELALTDAVVGYARQASGSRVDPKVISPLIGSLPTLADPAEVLDTVSGADAEAGDKLAALNPSEPRYVALRDKLSELRGKRKPVANAGKPLPSGPSLHVGMRDKRVPLLRARLGAAAGFGDDAEDDLFGSALSEALADWQRANELPTSGALDKRTLAALNGTGAHPASRLEGTLIANMEMWRWMPHDLGADRLEVNIPDYAVRVFHDGRVVDEHRVVVGKTDTPTPLFSNAMKYLIVNPYWNVPQSIIKKEMLPKGGGSLGYLEGRGYDVGYHNGMATVKQLPGPKNALGQIKFLFPNDYSVYLHDTPSKSLFAASKRAFSHGCVRVDKPFAFAESVLNDVVPEGTRSRWTQDKLEDMVGDKEHYVNLAKPLPIHIEYFTAGIEDGDQVKLREDIYGYAHAVATALGQDSEPAPAVKPKEPKEKPAVVAERPRRRAVVEADVDPRVVAPPVSRGFFSGLFDPR